MTKNVQENDQRAKKVRSHQYQLGQVVKVPDFHERTSHQRKEKTCRFNGRSILYERKEASKARVKTMEREEQQFGVFNKLSEKLEFPQKDSINFCENSSWFSVTSTTETNQHHSKPAAEQ